MILVMITITMMMVMVMITITLPMEQAACCVGDPTCVDCLTGLLPGLKNERRGSQGDDDCLT